MLTPHDYKVIADVLDLAIEFLDVEALNEDLIKRIKHRIAVEDLSVVPTSQDLSQAAHIMFTNLKKQVDDCGYSETLDMYRQMKIQAGAKKIQMCNKPSECRDTVILNQIDSSLLIADAYLMILESPEDMFKLGELS